MHVVAVGEVLVDWLSLTPGKTLLDATTFHRALGGNATNVAIGLTRLGTTVSLIGKIGTDLHGEFVKGALAAEKVDLAGIVSDPTQPTTQCYMTTSAEGNHQYRNWPHPNANDMLTFEELPAELLRTCELVHTTGISMVVDPRCATIEKAIDLAHANGAIISFDASLTAAAFKGAARRVEAIFAKTHLLKMNATELLCWAGLYRDCQIEANNIHEIELVGREVFDRYQPHLLLVTLGSKGSLIFTSRRVINCPPLAVQAISEVGAGDAFCAGFIHYLGGLLPAKQKDARARLAGLKEADIRLAGLAGNVAGALVTLKENAYAGLPDARQLQTDLARLAGGSDHH